MTKSVVGEICDRLSAGEPLARICADPRLPDLAAVARAFERSDSFRGRYDAARRFQAELWMDEMRQIADGEEVGPADGGDGRSQDLQRAKIRVEVRKYLVERLAPAPGGGRREEGARTDTPTSVLVMKYAEDPADPPAQ